MVTFDEAVGIVLDSARLLGVEQVGISEAAGRVLAEDVESDIDIPPFDKAAMDGYACRRADLGGELRVVESIPAGTVPGEKILAGQCAQIMTGGVVPAGANCVVMQEFVETVSADTVRFVGDRTADNICKRGEDIRAGDTVLCKGTLLRPQDVAVLAMVGCVRPVVARRPRVGVIATGDELVGPEEKPTGARIRNSNGFQLAAQARQSGAVVVNYGTVGDSEGALEKALRQGLDDSDVLLVSGGVSVGRHDLVRQSLRRLGVRLMFEKVAVKPGKPTVFGMTEKSFCFGLPGNPVSVFVMFELMVKPFLYRLMGHQFRAACCEAELAETISSKRADRDSWLPVAFVDTGAVGPVEYHGSAHINALCGADGLICVPAGVSEMPKGTRVVVRRI